MTVDGTWRTWPTFEITATAGTSVKVADGAGGAFVEIARAFSGGEEVVVDCEAERAWVDGEPADADVAEGSDFFWLDPGAHALSFTGASDFTTRFTERYA